MKDSINKARLRSCEMPCGRPQGRSEACSSADDLPESASSAPRLCPTAYLSMAERPARWSLCRPQSVMRKVGHKLDFADAGQTGNFERARRGCTFGDGGVVRSPKGFERPTPSQKSLNLPVYIARSFFCSFAGHYRRRSHQPWRRQPGVCRRLCPPAMDARRARTSSISTPK